MFKKRIITMAVIISIGYLTKVSAQTEMTLHDCMKYAVTNSTQLKIKRTEISDARAERSKAYAQAFTPDINASTYASFNFGRAVDPETNTYKSIQTFNNGYSLNAQFTLFDGFSAINNIKVARTALKMGISQQQLEKDKLCLDVMQAYYNVVYSSHMKKVCVDMVKTAEENLRLVQRQEELGEKSHADVVHIEAEVAGRKYELAEMTSLYNNAVLQLKDIMLWQSADDIKVDMSVAEAKNLIHNSISTSELTDKAKTFLPSLSIAKNKVENAKLNKRIAKASMLPTLSVAAGWNTSYYTYQGITTASFSKQFSDNSGEYVQFVLSVPLFNSLSGRTRYVKAKNAQLRATAEYEQALHDVESEVTRILQERTQAKAAYEQADISMHSQEEAYRMDLSKMKKGLISPLELRASADAYMKAKAVRIDALLKYYLKRSVAEYYSGVSYMEQIN